MDHVHTSFEAASASSAHAPPMAGRCVCALPFSARQRSRNTLYPTPDGPAGREGATEMGLTDKVDLAEWTAKIVE